MDDINNSKSPDKEQDEVLSSEQVEKLDSNDNDGNDGNDSVAKGSDKDNEPVATESNDENESETNPKSQESHSTKDQENDEDNFDDQDNDFESACGDNDDHFEKDHDEGSISSKTSEKEHMVEKTSQPTELEDEKEDEPDEDTGDKEVDNEELNTESHDNDETDRDAETSKVTVEKDVSDKFSKTVFEEVDSAVKLNKSSSAADDFDALCDDRTQNILSKEKKTAPIDKTSDDVNEEKNKDDSIPSPMEVDTEADGGGEGCSSENRSNDNLDDVEMRSIEREDKDNNCDEHDSVEENDDKENEREEPMEDDDTHDIEGQDDVDKSGDADDIVLGTEEQIEKEKEAEGNVEAEEPGESADVCLIPDNDEELTGAEKEQAILARQNAEKENPEEEEQVEEQNKTDAQVASNDDPSNDDADAVIEVEEAKQDSEEPQKIIITAIVHCDKVCKKCEQQKSCEYRYKDAEIGGYSYLCETACIEAFTAEQTEKFFIRRKKYMVEDVMEDITDTCVLCKELKICKYSFKQDEDIIYICNDDCFNLLTKEEPDKLRLKRNSIRVKDLSNSMQPEPESKIVARTSQEAEIAKLDRETSFIRRCVCCATVLNFSQENLQWQTLDFCNQLCLGKYQHQIGEKCRTCSGAVSHQSLSKYCVRFGFEICQFCCASCLDKYKKSLKNCSYCQKDIANGTEGFLAPVGDNEQFKDFCSQSCMRNYDILINPKRKSRIDQCSVCNNKKLIRLEIFLDNREHNFCSNPCFSAFKFVNNIVPDRCGMCTKYFERKTSESYTIYNEKGAQVFCGQICMNMFITQNRKIIFCQWCKVKKYNFDMIEKHMTNNEIVTMCSLNCLVLYGVSVNAITKQKMKCDNCLQEKTPQYHLTMSDSSIRNFCTYQCVMQFQSQFSRAPLTLEGEKEPQSSSTNSNISPFPTGLPKRVKPSNQTLQVPPVSVAKTTVPVIANITSLAGDVRRTVRRIRKKGQYDNIEMDTPSPPPQPPPLTQLRQTPGRVYTTQIMQPVVSLPKLKMVSKKTIGTMTTESGNKTAIIAVPPLPPKMVNKNTMCKPLSQSKGVTCKPLSFNTGCQTDEDMSAKILIPVPVPIFIPQPMYMYSAPFPIPVPIPLPIPIPIFIPTTRNSANGIMKEIKKIHDKMPADPFEAELLMMAEMVAGDKKKEDSDSDDDEDMGQDVGAVAYANNEVIVDANNSFGEDVLQMALKMATEYDEPAVDLESAMTASTITQPPPGSQLENDEEDTPLIYHQMQLHDTPRPGRGRKRMASNVATTGRNNRMQNTGNKRQRRNDVSVIHQPDPVMSIAPSPTPPSQIITTEKPDANMCLKYTFGVNAWKQWVMTKNADLEKSSIRRKPFKSELLQMTADELNYSLCLFVKEVRKPNGTEYAPDTIYYLVLGIQQYLYENGRIDNIFTDPYYERFTDCLDEVAKKFSILYNDSQYIVTRVEEEHLWECKQLGAHSPHVLLSTLMFFNTKHFNLTTVEEHMQLSFSHIMKHWKRNAQGTKAPGSRNVLLRFYPPQAGGDSRKKKVYEQQENEANPLRCPVRLYEFYLSKCPESVKTRNDVFYLQPERSCVPDSPVWYSTQALSQENLQKMLHRVKMVKEINVALLTI